MGRKVVPLAVNKKNLTKAEIEARKKAEAKLQPNKDKIKCPRWLGREAKKEWRRVREELEELGLLTNIDITALAIYCDAFSKLLQANEEIESRGMFVEYTNNDGATNTIENPAVRTANRYADLIRKMCGEFGLTPSARCKLTLPKQEEKEETPFDRMFGGV